MNQLDDIKKNFYKLFQNNYFNLNSEKIKAYSALIFVLSFFAFLIYKFLSDAQRDNERSAKVAENLKKRGVGALQITAPRPSFLTTDDNGNLSKFDPSGKEKLNNDFRIEGEMEADALKVNGNSTVSGNVSANSVVLNNNNNSVGSISLNNGNDANNGRNAGFINFNYKDGKRKAYLGFDDLNNNMIAFEGENGCNGLRIKGVNANLTVDNIVEAKQLNIKTNNTAGGTHLNWPDGKNYLTGDTIVRGGELKVKTNNPAGDTHLSYSDGKNYLTGETIVRGGKFCIGNTCMTEEQFGGLIEGLRGMAIHLSNGNVRAAGGHYQLFSKF